MKAITTNQMRNADQRAIKEYGIDGIILMEHAALALYSYIQEHFDPSTHILILCGPGNNGGDGFALARLLIEEGYAHTALYCNVEKEKMSHDERIFANIIDVYSIPLYKTKDLDEIEHLINKQDLIVDALFGTGLSRNIEGFYYDLIQLVNRNHAFVLSVDIASGIHGDSGSIMNCAIQADVTVTFACYKYGQLLYPGSLYCGNIIVKDITIPKPILDEMHGITVLDDEIVKDLLPKRSAYSHKGSYGKALMVGGSARMHGALTLSAKSALYSGIGMLTLFVPAIIHDILAMKMEESMIIDAPCENGYFSMAAVKLLQKELVNYDFVSMGNGMGRNEASDALVKTVLESDRPCILDGDAIFSLGKQIWLLQRDAVTIITPHPKEMSYLCHADVKDIKKNLIFYATAFAKEYPNVVLVLKDQHTLIAYRDQLYLNMAGNHALAKGGSGDVLCGIISGLFGQGKDGLSAAACGVYVHAKTADLLLSDVDANSILPTHLIEHLSDTYRNLRK